MPKEKAKKVRIVQKSDPVLRAVAEPVPLDKVRSRAVQMVIADMKAAMEPQTDAVAIAAPQIGQSVRIFVISHRAFDISRGDVAVKAPSDMVFVNPRLIKTSKKKEYMEEGCLSVRYMYGKVNRAEKATIEAYDEHGRKFTRGFSGLLAQIVQHETDHLDGTLFIDKAKHLHEISHEEYERMLKSV
ncbi:MAG: peptide deformylase [Patescibacteria group bacterium]|nr:peptide deformylase [Patescibacteria group bacterium]MDE1945974.1 peptide deformylase [Patescibacteria group bacterium]